MTDRPVIFSAPMVLALLAGRKTQTRRLATSPLRRCEPGDRLWVRENFRGPHAYEANGYALADWGNKPLWYTADGEPFPAVAWQFWPKARPSIHMPRWASRLTLIVEAVRVERLQEISAADCYAEGVERPAAPMLGSEVCARDNARNSYRSIWQALHGADSWADNPEVVAITFRVVRGNIDRGEGK